MRRTHQAGVTLVEMIAVVAIIGLIAAISFPAISAGLESIRLASATDAVAAFLNAALVRAERRQQTIEVTVSITANNLALHSTEPGFVRSLPMPQGVTLVRVHPQLPESAEETERRFYIQPYGAIPGVGIELANARGVHRIVRVDPTTGVAQVEQVQQQQ